MPKKENTIDIDIDIINPLPPPKHDCFNRKDNFLLSRFFYLSDIIIHWSLLWGELKFKFYFPILIIINLLKKKIAFFFPWYV